MTPIPAGVRLGKLVVAGMNEQGRSCVISTTELPDERGVNIWNGDTAATLKAIGALAPDEAAAKVEPVGGPGGFRWVLNRIPPAAEAAARGYTPMGMHVTRTIDFDYVVAGTVQCILDEEVVDLHAGDFLILEAARHAWRNPTDTWAVKLALLHVPAGIEL
jgi:mannose-6-phosphate isomerase-like protein (cupin superfamily)